LAYEEAFDVYRNQMNPASVRKFDRTLSIGTPPAIFAAYFDAFRAGLNIEMERAVVDICQVGIANATTLKSHPVGWTNEHLTLLLDAYSTSINHWIKSACDKQNNLRPDEDVEGFIFWKHWRAPRLIRMQPSGNSPYDASSVWTRDDEQGTANILVSLANRFIVLLKADLGKMVGALYIEYAKAGFLTPLTKASAVMPNPRQMVEKSAPKTPKLGQKKQDLSRYLDSADMTERQYECLSLRLEYGMRKSHIARRLGIDRKTLDEHIAAGERKIAHAKNKLIVQRNSAKLDPGRLRD
jgi:DNA-binding CsgD family transcriptional regulator